MKILVIQQKRIGDVLTSSILCNILKEHYPEAHIDFLCYPNCTAVLEHNPNIESIITLSNPVRKSYLKLLDFIKGIRKREYEIVIDVYSKLETNLITGLSGATTRISYKKGYSAIFYNHNIERVEKWTKSQLGAAIENRLRLLKPLIAGRITNFRPKIFLAEAEISKAKSTLLANSVDPLKPLAMIGILGSEWYKTYPLEQMAKLLDFTVEKTGSQLLFNYIPSQLDDAKKLYDFCSQKTRDHIFFDLYAQNLRDFIGLLSQCDMLIGNEGGAVNMAKALDIPTFSIFSPSVDKETWQIFEDEKNVSIHLKDIRPEIYEAHDEKYIKEHTFEFFAEYPLEHILSELDTFFKAVL
ncbi:glycosyltransferase family 9 protein [Flavobacterium silvaticum]|uniref:Glycosyltransferase family 9 protein n=1 Tax=Flavobacterium silvaticum TaxID=1852020 RepID=A0A972G2F1_9FLAO|nr:glycosyltransferase family 9 protein [Flavobacterium silvaticum]NMH29226.1 glycosyltransferase family 9 protein [Flavobacterium silvaticum]